MQSIHSGTMGMQSILIGGKKTSVEEEHVRNLNKSIKMQMETMNVTELKVKHLKELTNVQFFVSKNWMNSAAFVVTIAVSIFLGILGLGRDVKGNYKDIHDQYQTLITPIYWTHAMWLVIFLLEGIFVIIQSLPAFREHPIFQKGVNWFFFYANIFQFTWIIGYTHDSPVLATLAMLLNVIMLCLLCSSVYFVDTVENLKNEVCRHAEMLEDENEPLTKEMYAIMNMNMDPTTEYTFLRFPFQLHLGWAIFTCLLTFNEMAIFYDWGGVHPIAIGSIVILWLTGIVALFFPKYPAFPIPLAIAWGAMGIWVEINNPRSVIVQEFNDATILRVRGGAIATCIENVVLPLLRFVYFFAQNYNIFEKELEQ